MLSFSIPDARGALHSYIVSRPRTSDALRIQGRLARVLGPVLVRAASSAVGAVFSAVRDGSASVDLRGVIATLVRDVEGNPDRVAEAFVQAIGHVEMPALVGDLLANAVRDNVPLIGEAAESVFVDPYEPVRAAYEVARLTGFFALSGLLPSAPAAPSTGARTAA